MASRRAGGSGVEKGTSKAGGGTGRKGWNGEASRIERRVRREGVQER